MAAIDRTSTAPGRAGFSSTELGLVLVTLFLLAGVVVPHLSARRMAARDTRRVRDIEMLRDAIERFHLERGRYPAARVSASDSEWDVSHDGDFIPELVAAGYLDSAPTDPSDDQAFHYAYGVYPRGSCDCVGTGPFYVLGIRRFESDEFARRNEGYFVCAGRDWSDAFDYVTGGGATYQ